MARRRPIESSQGLLVPAELKDHTSLTWRIPELFEPWCRRHLPPDRCPTVAELLVLLTGTWPGRFTFACDRWTVAVGLVDERQPRTPDRAAMAERGIGRPSSLERAAANHGADIDCRCPSRVLPA